MREVDRLAVEELGLLLIQMMENAGVRLAELALRRFRPEAVAVLCGPGGTAAARATPEVVGELYLADISIPPGLYSGLGIRVGPIFGSGPILRLR
jgi:hypothetical protein